MFYDNLKEVCEERGTTVTTVLKALKFSSGSTGNWKKGVLPTLEKAISLSEYLGVPIDRLVYGKRPEVSSALDPEWAEIIERIPEERHQMCKDFLRTHMVIPEKYAQGKIG